VDRGYVTVCHMTWLLCRWLELEPSSCMFLV